MDYDATIADARFDATRLETEGKMIGALVGTRRGTGERVTLKAFSGQLFGEWRVEGWAPPVGELTHDTAYYKSEHGKIKALSERIAKAEMEERMTRAEVREATAARDDEAKALAAEAKRAKEARRRARADGASDATVEALDEESRASKRAMSTLKKARDAAVAPKLEILARLRARIDDMKSERKALSRALQDKIWDRLQITEHRRGSSSASRRVSSARRRASVRVRGLRRAQTLSLGAHPRDRPDVDRRDMDRRVSTARLSRPRCRVRGVPRQMRPHHGTHALSRAPARRRVASTPRSHLVLGSANRACRSH